MTKRKVPTMGYETSTERCRTCLEWTRRGRTGFCFVRGQTRSESAVACPRYVDAPIEESIGEPGRKTAPRTDEESVQALADLFESIPWGESDEEVDTALRELGYDPDALADRMNRFVDHVLKRPPPG